MKATDCPNPDVLSRYAVGRLSETESAEVDSHLIACNTCLGLLDRIGTGSADTFANALRSPDVSGKTDLVAEFRQRVAPLLLPRTDGLKPKPDQISPESMLGEYRVLDRLGEGGMGTVYRAVHARLATDVAVKVIRPGMASPHALARFEAERQVLALMHHPGVARVLDGGTTADGRPFFVMELVHGEPITQYCQERNLPIVERLELFVAVCQAVQHAHQKGIIHRDLKPSNVLVTEFDGKPVPKVIDFGVAKLIDRKPTATLHTEVGMVVGTPEYMSPEQAELDAPDVDTRSDVHALGVLLYELLTGETPFDRVRLRNAPILEVLRIIREEEPPAPSTRMSKALSTLRVSRLHELDWIALKALEKDRARRYDTVGAFADDVRRFLSEEPVLAGPPSASYRLSKFIRRNRGAVIAAALMLLALFAGTAGTSIGMIRARVAEGKAIDSANLANDRLTEVTSEKNRATHAEAVAVEERDAAQAVAEFLGHGLLAQASAFRQADAQLTLDPNIKLRTVLDRAAKSIDGQFDKQPRIEAKLRYIIGRTYYNLGANSIALSHLIRAYELMKGLYGSDDADFLNVISHLAGAYERAKEWDKAEPLFRRVLEVVRQRFGDKNVRTIEATTNLAGYYAARGQFDQVKSILTPLLDVCVQELGTDHKSTLVVKNQLGLAEMKTGNRARAEELLTEAYERHQQLFTADHPTSLFFQHTLGEAYLNWRDYAKAEDLLRKAAAGRERVYGPDSRVTLISLSILGLVYRQQKLYAKAEPLLVRVAEGCKRNFGPDHADTLTSIVRLANMYGEQGNKEKAEPVLVEAVDCYRRAYGANDSRTVALTINLSVNYTNRNLYDRAEPYALAAVEAVRQNQTIAPEHFHGAYQALCSSLIGQSKFDAADPVIREYLDAHDSRMLKRTHLYYNVKSMLGDILRRRERFADAEPILLDAYAGLLDVRMSPTARFPNLTDAWERVDRLYVAWGKPEKTAEWRTKNPKPK